MGIDDAPAVEVSVAVVGGERDVVLHTTTRCRSMLINKNTTSLQVAVANTHPLSLLFASRAAQSPQHLLSSPLQAHLSKFTAAKTPLSLEDWYSCFSRCPELLSTSPQVLSERLTKLKELMSVDEEQLVSAVTKAPSLLQHAPADIADKVCACIHTVHNTSKTAHWGIHQPTHVQLKAFRQAIMLAAAGCDIEPAVAHWACFVQQR